MNYILLKNLPDVKAGSIGKQVDTNIIFNSDNGFNAIKRDLYLKQLNSIF